MDVVAVFVGSFGLLGFLAFLFLLIFSIATKRSKALPAICMVVCLVLLGVGAVGFMMTRPGTDTSGNQSLDGSGDDSGMVEAGLFNVKLTVPAEYVEDGMTQEMLDEQVKESKMKEAKLNEDGSVTYTMSKSQHKELMKGIKEGIDAGLSELENSEDYPSFVKIEANGDYTKYTVTVNTDELSLAESLSVLGFYLLSGTYHAFNGTQVDNVCVQFVNEATGEVIQEANSRDMGAIDEPSSAPETANPVSGKSEYSIGETWVVEEQWELTITGVTEINERNKFSDKTPGAVYIIDYTYKNLGFEESYSDGLYISIADTVVDSQGKMGYEYPGNITKYPQETPIGATCDAQTCIGVENPGDFKLTVSKYDGNDVRQSTVFSVSVG